MSKVLLTGSRGLLGSRIHKRLLNHGHEVIGLDAQPAQTDGDVQGSVTDRKLINELVGKVDSVIHVAGVINESTLSSQLLITEVNVLGTAVLLSEVAAAGKKVVFASSGSVYGPDSTLSPFDETSRTDASVLKPYGFSKFQNEKTATEFAKIADFQWIGLRLAAILGGGLNRVGTSAHLYDVLHAESSEITLNTNPENAIDWIDVEDAAELFVLALELENFTGVINASSGVAHPIGRLVQQLQELIDSKVAITWNHEAPAHQRVYTNDLCKKLLGYTPSTDLKRALAEVAKAKINI